MSLSINRPQPGEYPDYYQTYMDQLPEGEVLHLLEKQVVELKHLLENINDSLSERSYEPGKWSIKELLQHMLDSERIFAYRALCFSRGELASLPGYDENLYASNSMAHSRQLDEILEEYELVRRSNLLLFRSFTSEMMVLKGVANGKQMTLRGLIHVMAAHELHHMNILRDRYLQVIK